jgi:hypothetical protein
VVSKRWRVVEGGVGGRCKIDPEEFPRLIWRAVALELSEEFRRNAHECLELSRKADSLVCRGYWVAMAQFWLDLAVHGEDRAAIKSVDPSIIDAASDKDHGKQK